ncbi:MAG: PucR family transcriptional regulator [Pseudomonadota bacterium]
MTKVITRYFDSADAAKRARSELIKAHQVSQRIITICETSDAVEQLASHGVLAATIDAYKGRMAQGGAVMMVKAGFKPLGVAKTTRNVTAMMGGAVLGGDVVEEVVTEDDRKIGLKIYTDHPLLLSRARDPESTTFHMADWPIPLISRRRPSTFSLVPQHAHMANWPIPLISHNERFTFMLIEPHARMANFPIPLISRRKPKDSFAFPRHKRFANFPIPLISKRKPYTGSLIGKHPRMANWPFPHLINGTANNSLVPGGKRMANFPISLLSDRKPFTGSIFSRHARMANFPIGLISKRKPADRFAFPRHARMADRILPLISRNFSFSSLFGMRTLKPR